jgi:hypothetical protein
VAESLVLAVIRKFGQHVSPPGGWKIGPLSLPLPSALRPKENCCVIRITVVQYRGGSRKAGSRKTTDTNGVVGRQGGDKTKE